MWKRYVTVCFWQHATLSCWAPPAEARQSVWNTHTHTDTQNFWVEWNSGRKALCGDSKELEFYKAELGLLSPDLHPLQEREKNACFCSEFWAPEWSWAILRRLMWWSDKKKMLLQSFQLRKLPLSGHPPWAAAGNEGSSLTEQCSPPVTWGSCQ